MEIRPADPDDRERIRAVAHDSIRSSYSLSPQQIETIVEEEFGDGILTERLEEPDTVVLVADHTIEGTEEVLGFVDVATGSESMIRWLHVDPEARGEGIATALIERVREDADGTPVAARVLEDAVEGGEFFEEFGLEPDGNDRIEIGGEEFAATLFREGGETDAPNEPTVTVPESVAVDGVDRPVDRDESIPGREAPFFSAYSDEDREEPYGYFCSQCGSTNVSADGLDRLECGNCGNVHLADEWDDAYL
jgi:GNAT superfamily N-acetyltransferase/ribosomal protein S27AE